LIKTLHAIVFIMLLLQACAPAALLVPLAVKTLDVYTTAKPVVIEIQKLRDLRR